MEVGMVEGMVVVLVEVVMEDTVVPIHRIHRIRRIRRIHQVLPALVATIMNHRHQALPAPVTHRNLTTIRFLKVEAIMMVTMPMLTIILLVTITIEGLFIYFKKGRSMAHLDADNIENNPLCVIHCEFIASINIVCLQSIDDCFLW